MLVSAPTVFRWLRENPGQTDQKSQSMKELEIQEPKHGIWKNLEVIRYGK